MTQSDPNGRMRFWPLVGIASGVALLFALAYALLRPGFSLGALSDSLCISALLLSLASGIPFLLDAGRGLAIPGKMGQDKDQQREILRDERRKRERGMRITFALALAAFLIGLASLLLSLI
jgi:predicted nucleic acid-binding Zn ribbon protein